MRFRIPVQLAALFMLTAVVSGCFTTRYAIPPEHSAANYEIVRSFEIKGRSSWLIFGLVPLSEPELEEKIAEEVRRYDGDAATNVVVEAQYDAVDVVISAIVGGLYNSRAYKVRGDIVKIRPSRGALLQEGQKLTYRDGDVVLGGITYR